MKHHHNQNTLVIALQDELDFSNSTEVKSDIRDHLVEKDQNILLDLRDLKFIDSSGVGMIISLLKTAHARGGKLVVCEVTEEVLFVLKMTKVDQIIDIKSSVAEGLAAMEV